MLEKDLEEKCRRNAKRAGGKLLKFISPGNKGVPDRILIMPYVVAFIEFKKPGRHKVQPLQDWWHAYLERIGVPVFRVQSLAHFNNIVRMYRD